MAIVEEKYEVWRKLAHSVLRNYGEWRVREDLQAGENAQGVSLGILSQEDIEDIFHAVLEKYILGPGEERFLSWCERKEVDATRGFLRLLFRGAETVTRKRLRRKAILFSSLWEREEEEDAGFDAVEDRMLVQSILSSLKEEYKYHLVALGIMAGKTQQEIAKELGVTQKAISRRLAVLRQYLRERWEEKKNVTSLPTRRTTPIPRKQYRLTYWEGTPPQ